MLYKSNNSTATDSGASWEAGPYKFQIDSAELHSRGNIMMKLKTKTEDGQAGPNITEWLNLTSEKDGAIKELDRRLMTILGKLEINSAADLVGKQGYIVLRKGEKYLEACPFGGFYTIDRKSATGKESMSERIEEAMKYVAVGSDAPVSTPETDDDIPF
jgi:hypothetical protein